MIPDAIPEEIFFPTLLNPLVLTFFAPFTAPCAAVFIFPLFAVTPLAVLLESSFPFAVACPLLDKMPETYALLSFAPATLALEAPPEKPLAAALLTFFVAALASPAPFANVFTYVSFVVVPEPVLLVALITEFFVIASVLFFVSLAVFFKLLCNFFEDSSVLFAALPIILLTPNVSVDNPCPLINCLSASSTLIFPSTIF